MAHSDLYAADHHWGEAPVDLTERALPALKARYLLDALPREGRVLEIGCGGGRLLNTIAVNRPDLQLDGCDIRPLEHEARAFEFALVDPDDPQLPYDDATFDAVVLFDVLEHVFDPLDMVHAARAVLRDSGRVISFTPLEGQAFSFYRMFRRVFGDNLYVETKEHVQAFSEADVRALFASDFDLVDVEYAYHCIGHLMDATLFALTRIPAVRKRFWETNPYYSETTSPQGDRGGTPSTSTFGSLLQFANRVAYSESRLLRRYGIGAAGILLTGRAR